MTKCRQYNAGQFHFLGEFFLATDVGSNDNQTIPDNSRQLQTIPGNSTFLGKFSLQLMLAMMIRKEVEEFFDEMDRDFDGRYKVVLPQLHLLELTQLNYFS